MVAYGPLPSFHDIAQPLRALLTEHLSARCYPPTLQVRLDPEVGGQAGVSSSEAPGGRPALSRLLRGQGSVLLLHGS